MIDPMTPAVGSDKWMHELRNAVNSATLAAFAADTLIAAGDVSQAHQFLQQVQQACDQCRVLVRRTADDSDS